MAAESVSEREGKRYFNLYPKCDMGPMRGFISSDSWGSGGRALAALIIADGTMLACRVALLARTSGSCYNKHPG